MKTIMMVEDEGMLSELFVEYVQMLPDVKYLGCVSEGHLAMKRCLELKPDIIILDIRLPGVNGLEMLRRIRKELPESKVIVFSGSLDAYSVRMALNGDAHGFVEKAYGLTELNNGIMEVMKGNRYYSQGAKDYVDKLTEKKC
jgi:DNA-binding NarL/FixJ family response regulator